MFSKKSENDPYTDDRLRTNQAGAADSQGAVVSEPWDTAQAAYRQGEVLEQQGDVGRALVAYQQVIESGYRDLARQAVRAQESLLQRLGEMGGFAVVDAYQWVVDSGLHLEHTPWLALSLGRALERVNVLSSARTAYQRAIDSRHLGYAPEAAWLLGRMLERQGGAAGAQTAYQQAVDIGQDAPDADQRQYAAKAARSQGNFLGLKGRVAEAFAVYRQAISSFEADIKADELRWALLDKQDVAGARAVYQWASESGEAAGMYWAAYSLGSLLADRGDIPGALTAYQQAIDSGREDDYPGETASLAQEQLLRNPIKRNAANAIAAYQWALDSGYQEQAELAASNLESVLSLGDGEDAWTVYQWALDSGQLEQAPEVACSLGHALQRADREGARTAYQWAIDSGDHENGAIAAYWLGHLLEKEMDVAGARAAYQRAIDSGHREFAAKASEQLGQLLEAQGDAAGAITAYQTAIDSGRNAAIRAAARLRDGTDRSSMKRRNVSPAGNSGARENESNPSGLNNRERVGRGLDLLATGLNEFTGAHLPASHSSATDWTEVFMARDRERGRPAREYSLTDSQFQLRLLTEERVAFGDDLSRSARAYASELRETRNRWAHVRPFSDDDADRALDTIARLLTTVGATDQAAQVRKLR